jgi:N-acetylglucosamine kinase-like BadF-type ATPase
MAGNVIASGSTLGANVVSLGVDEACRALWEGTRDVLRRGGSSVGAVQAAVLGIAGVDREPHRSGVQRWLAGALPGSLQLVVTDVELVIAAGTAKGVGMAVVSGTGSVILARDASGRTVKIGGRGPVEGDPGSGHAIGLAALGTGRFRPVSESPRDIAALVPDIVAAADAGDADAIDILQTAGRDLAEQAVEAIRMIGWAGKTVPCALGGGVIVNVETVREAFVASARELGLLLSPVTLVPRPVEGAIMTAMRLAAEAETGTAFGSDDVRPARLGGVITPIDRPSPSARRAH